ncbi:MAG: peptide chain release factor N(5)-glutamine methyltransferase [Firmicutes bacterium]|nr:peptide chain release factor N(5)-glutamine methyltransferase [Bacillota bacterium]
MTMTVRIVLQETARFFAKHGLEAARLEAELLLAHLLGVERLRLYTDPEQPLSGTELNRYKELIRRRLSGEPLAYITGKRNFLKWDFTVTPAVLVPRPETEILVEKTLALLEEETSGQILELGTGSGVITIALAHYLPAFYFEAVELSPAALAVASENAARHQLSERIAFFEGDLYEALPAGRDHAYTAIVSNPPYIPSGVIPSLAREVRKEPRQALDGGPDGLQIIRRIISRAAEFLAPGGFLALEHGHDQKPMVERLAREAGFSAIQSYHDYSGFPRITICQLCGSRSA